MEETVIILNLILMFILKIIDNMLGTGRTILIQKNKGLLAALTVIMSQVIFYNIIYIINNSDSKAVLYVVSVAGGLGTYIAIKINNKLSKDRIYVNIIMSDNKEEMVKLREYLREHKITNLVTDGYTKDWDKTLAITAYAQTKNESKLLDKYINGSCVKFKRVITKN